LPFGPEADRLTVTQAFNDPNFDHNDATLPFTYSLDFVRANGATLGTAVKAQGSGTIVHVASGTPDTPHGEGTYALHAADKTHSKPYLAEKPGYDAYLGPHGFGNYVTVKYDDGFYATYMHLNQSFLLQNAATLHDGASIKSGQTIGLVGSNGAITGPHLHVTYGQHVIGIGTDEGKTTFKGTAAGSATIDFSKDALADGSVSDNPDGVPVHFLATEIVNGSLRLVADGRLHETDQNGSDYYIANNVVTSSEGVNLTSTNQSIGVDQASNMDGWFFASDTDGDPFQWWAVEDLTPVPGGGHFHIPGGYVLSGGNWVPVGAGDRQAGEMILLLTQQLAATTFVGGGFVGVQEKLAVTAFDGHQWGNWTTFTVATDHSA
jgi:hypothetical protein